MVSLKRNITVVAESVTTNLLTIVKTLPAIVIPLSNSYLQSYRLNNNFLPQLPFNATMAGILNEVASALGSVIDNIAEVLSLVHWLSDFVFLLSLLQLLNSNGVIQGYLIWLTSSLVTSLVSGIIAELLTSAIPTPLRALKPLIAKIVDLTSI